jgi:hypothetical protein
MLAGAADGDDMSEALVGSADPRDAADADMLGNEPDAQPGQGLHYMQFGFVTPNQGLDNSDSSSSDGGTKVGKKLKYASQLPATVPRIRVPSSVPMGTPATQAPDAGKGAVPPTPATGCKSTLRLTCPYLSRPRGNSLRSSMQRARVGRVNRGALSSSVVMCCVWYRAQAGCHVSVLPT